MLGGLNPARRVPTLVLDDGRPLAESNAIIWYFAEGTPYLPEDRFERAKVLQWLFFEQYDHEPAIAVCRFWVAFSASPHAARRPRSTARRRRGYRALDALERHLADEPFLVGEPLTIADIALYAYTHVADEGGFDLSPTRASRPGSAAWPASQGTSRSRPRAARAGAASSPMLARSPRRAPSQLSGSATGLGRRPGYRGSRCWWKCGMPYRHGREDTAPPRRPRSAPGPAGRGATDRGASSSFRSPSADVPPGGDQQVAEYGAGRPSSGSGGTWNATTRSSS